MKSFGYSMSLILIIVFGIACLANSQEIKPAIIYTKNNTGFASQKVYIEFSTCSKEETRCSVSEDSANITRDYNSMKDEISKLQQDVQLIFDSVLYSRTQSKGT